MKRLLRLIALMLCLLLPVCALAQPLELAQPLSGGTSYPADVPKEEATYQFTYAFPQFAADNDADKAINAYYQAISNDMVDAMGERYSLEADEPGNEGMVVELAYQVMLNDDRYLSVILSSRQLGGNAENETISADTFARDGVYAGQPLTLSQVLGLEQEGDELSDEQSEAEKLAYRLVWGIVERDAQNVDADFLDGVTQEVLEAAFSPETDFYMDVDGNIVFFIQSGVIAGEVAGILEYPFAPAELLSAVKE